MGFNSAFKGLKLLIASKLQLSERNLNLWSSRPWNWAPKNQAVMFLEIQVLDLNRGW